MRAVVSHAEGCGPQTALALREALSRHGSVASVAAMVTACLAAPDGALTPVLVDVLSVLASVCGGDVAADKCDAAIASALAAGVPETLKLVLERHVGVRCVEAAALTAALRSSRADAAYARFLPLWDLARAAMVCM